MIAIRITFPTRRWHATAWGTHVNEGVPEWPPCPWRLLRALLAAWFWKDRRDETVLRSLLEKLSAVAPDYLLPEATSAHTRHYMPVVEGKSETRTKIFDTFVHVSDNEPVWIRWDVDLTRDETDLLARLLANLSYMGRAESLIAAELVAPRDPELVRAAHDQPWTRPAEFSSLTSGEPIRLLAPQSPSAYTAWLASQSNSSGGKKTRGRKKGVTLPESVFDALQLDTADWKKDGWNLPPGSRWIDYIRPRDCFKIVPVSRLRKRTLAGKEPKVARFAIVAKVPPGITQSLSLAERFHQALCAKLKDTSSPALTGLDAKGNPLAGNQHAYFLPECDLHGYITHMTVHAPCGFSPEDSRALSKLRSVWAIEGKGAEIDIVLLATGQPEDFKFASPYFRPARLWRSLTPFVPVRHPKATRAGIPKIDPENGLQKGSPEHDCFRLFSLVAPDKPQPRVRRLGSRIQFGLRDIPCLDFQRQRRNGGGTRGDHHGYALELEFNEPTTIPFGLGYGAHFGLGLFVPVLEDPSR